jgi:hypothetical protein
MMGYEQSYCVSKDDHHGVFTRTIVEPLDCTYSNQSIYNFRKSSFNQFLLTS